MTTMPDSDMALARPRPRGTRGGIVAAVVIALSLSTGCEFLGLDGGDPPEAPEETKQADEPEPKQAPPTRPEPKAADESEAAEYERPEYPNMSRRNPFQPDVEVIKPQDLPEENEERALEPLERFAIGQLALVAIISEVAVPKAMFIDPEGFGHVLKEGDRVGRNSGVVSDIRDNEIEITESTDEERGQTRLRTVKLRDVELRASGDAGLTEEEREALQKLMETEEGQEAVERFRRDLALGASTVDEEDERTTDEEREEAPRDRRFPGIRPPSQNQ